ncbi:MAG: hypothetical protein V7L01_13030 [Nostoc sp.]
MKIIPCLEAELYNYNLQTSSSDIEIEQQNLITSLPGVQEFRDK